MRRLKRLIRAVCIFGLYWAIVCVFYIVVWTNDANECAKGGEDG